MDNNIHYFPGGNTPKGFYSYYDNIIDQREADRIICLKGGPGTGKSTLMKSIGEHFCKSGEQVEYLWCSSDPCSLDGVLLKDSKTAVIDGTAPHVVDPVNPGAVDEIINLGVCWNESGIRKFRSEIISCGEKISEAFKFAYLYLKSAGIRYEYISDMLTNTPYINNKDIIYTIENDISKANVDAGRIKKRFASAITHCGVINKLDKISSELNKIYMIKAPVGYRTEIILKPLAARILEAGQDAELYYCPMDPEVKLEHIVLRELGIGIFTCNDYHGKELLESSNNVITIETDNAEGFPKEAYESLKSEAKDDISKAVKALKRAKSLHDELETYYVSNMDFEKISRIKNSLIDKIRRSR